MAAAAHPLTCVGCNTTFNLQMAYNQHMRWKCQLRFMCTVCTNEYGTRAGRTHHMSTSHPCNYPCEFGGGCRATLPSAEALRNHTRTVHYYACETCCEYFSTRDGVRRHVNTIHKRVKHFCHVGSCEALFNSTAAHNKHERDEHDYP